MRCDETHVWRSVNSKGAGRPRLLHHHVGWWNEMKRKWMRWVWRNGGMKIVVGENGRKLQEKHTHTPFRPPRNPHGVTETRTRDPSGERLQQKFVVVDLGFTTLLTSQVISVAFYSEREKSDKFCSQTLISAWGSFPCRKPTALLPFRRKLYSGFLRSEKIHHTGWVWTREPRTNICHHLNNHIYLLTRW